ncbi:hypothetical protein BV20DRAFT_971382 [Pilatotrama ljubarskyi]|nr:hypothetical protein BV20DRAFT_971382 [Pilatotrama ljubarskyi]
METFLPAIATLDDETLQELLYWLEQTSAASLPDESDPEPANNHIPVPSVDDFDRYLDGKASELPPDPPNHHSPNPSEQDWTSFINYPEPAPASSNQSKNSDHSASTLSAPSSLSSDMTFVDPGEVFRAGSAVAAGFYAEKLLDDADPFPTDQGIYAPPYGCPVTSSYTPTSPPIESTPLASSCYGLAHHGQPLQQHLSGATATSASGDMSTQADNAPLTTQPILEGSVPSPAGATSAGTKSRKRGSDDDSEEKPRKRRKPQSKEKTIICPECGSGWARKNNLTQHISSVHKGERAFACPEPGCDKAFSRNHDRKRHYQSEHTDLGSPRRKDPTA